MKLHRITAVLLTATTMLSAPTYATEVRLYKTQDLSAEILEARNQAHDIIIEECVGVVLDAKGNGRILSTGDYISYRYVDAKPGDVVLSLFIYNPDNGEVDDILYRVDFPTESRALRGIK